ncbi:DUF4352 domain-containing protein [Streptomyces sp. NPDC059378]|uniref:DUF4352 domain-containing protein n=1 Tax=Streptomyces sp. NPDC059378 TaxID=3346815 RepID=UPI003687BC4F
MPKGRLPRALTWTTLAAALTLPVAGCDAGSGSPAGPSPSAAVQRPSRAYRDGHLTFTLLSLRCDLTAVSGSHSEAQPDGQFCAIRLRVENKDPEFHTYVVARQRLEGVAGRRGRADTFAMAVRRQHDQVEIGGHDLVEVEIWYDVPRDAKVTGVRVSGDRDRAGFMDSRPVEHAPEGVLIPMKPLMGW